jgi:5-(carboxyamino)imidazole ribonucleotide synthase
LKRVGIIGGGQLARMLALAGHPLGIRCRILDPSACPPAIDVAEHVRGGYEDPAALADLVAGMDVVTCELEHVPPAVLRTLDNQVRVLPCPQAFEVAGDRLAEKRFLRGLALATAEFVGAETESDVYEAADRLGLPLVLKTRTHGYDGRGQMLVRDDTELRAALAALGAGPMVAEGFVSFDRELSIVAVRAAGGEIRTYPLVENRHRDGILVSTLAPAPAITPAIEQAAGEIAASVLKALAYVGVLTVELFQRGDELLVNELAPRVHNSGHWTIEGAATSQFENHLRAILSLPLGSTSAIGASALINLLGDAPALERILELPDTHVHLYNKASRPLRKIGHVTSRAASPADAIRRLDDLTRLS